MTKKIWKTGFCILWSLVFYFVLIGCQEKSDEGSISIHWDGSKAIGIIVPKKLLSNIPVDSVKELLEIRLPNNERAIIGDYIFDDDKVIFKPAIALTRGLKYNLYVKDKLLEEILIPAVTSANAPEVIAIYPSLDTVPENLLKFYISFSKPMQEGSVVDYIHLIKNGRDTLSSVFLDLQEELWNNERTMLTLWLDPGRIKRDLQPNKLLGPPLIKGSNYKLAIDKSWRDAEGISLKEKFDKEFFAGTRDSISPDEQRWIIDAPKPGSKDHLVIRFNESLDHVLAENTLSVTGADSNQIKGEFRVNDKGTILSFIPEFAWKPGPYTIEVELRLEDLAGNNLDRLFDTDLAQKQPSTKKEHKRSFEIR